MPEQPPDTCAAASVLRVVRTHRRPVRDLPAHGEYHRREAAPGLRADRPCGGGHLPAELYHRHVLTEVYGYRQARRVIWLGFLCNLIAVIAIWLGQILPAASFWDGQAAYERILGYTPRLLVASFLAYLVGEFTNATCWPK